MAKLTAVQILEERCVLAVKASNAARDKAATHQEANHIDMKSYEAGAGNAYNEASQIMTKELRRLMRLFQNGALTVDSFGVLS